ncbi:GGDEF domain-containing protein [Planktothrix sp. FACHB-1365]|uniref:GGDEF domain-containing protein n=1 Tax=Planktothrix sp. FACHB-1365 TaxID=2692855 RepID=UPI001687D4B3|nr:GGDEF domain-containing protein [Planktothrix sp. FACHB-1365]MBD2482904.1 GGDEF domain-containing protein [Planktothrix sp. FACHB-1365]
MLSSNGFDLYNLSYPITSTPYADLSSTLQNQYLYDFQVDVSEIGGVIAKSFNSNPSLPGVILTENKTFFGMISRRRFLERLSRPYGIELFFNRSLKLLYRWEKKDILILPGSTPILEATQIALQRLPDLVYEPIVVQLAPQTYRLIDMYQLLLAQSEIHQLAHQVLQELYHELQIKASLDGLTQIANRRFFDQYFEQQWLQLESTEFPLSLIFTDVDYFKAYNDTYGHHAGDDCLKQVAQVIAQTLTSDQGLVARYGGEEFVVVLPKVAQEQAILIAEKMRNNVKAIQIKHQSSSVSSYVTISLGIATVEFGHSEIISKIKTPGDLIIAADQALYQAKNQGRDQVVCSSMKHPYFWALSSQISLQNS